MTAIRSINLDKFSELKKVKQDIMFDYTVFGYFDKCTLLSDVLARHFGCFLQFYERRNKYRYLLKKKLQSKNEICTELSTCAQQKFNVYEFLRDELKHYKRKNVVAFDIVYEPPRNKQTPIYCYFVLKIYMAFAAIYKYGETRTIKSHIARIFLRNQNRKC